MLFDDMDQFEDYIESLCPDYIWVERNDELESVTHYHENGGHTVFMKSDYESTPAQSISAFIAEHRTGITILIVLCAVLVLLTGCNTNGRARTYSGVASPTPRPTMDPDFYIGCTHKMINGILCADYNQQNTESRQRVSIDTPFESIIPHATFYDFQVCVVKAIEDPFGRISVIHTFDADEDILVQACFLEYAGASIESSQWSKWYQTCNTQEEYETGYELTLLANCTTRFSQSNK